jgi:hypothetical protein
MDKVKEILRQAVKYRFWIAVGVSALLPLIAFFLANGKLKAEEEAEKAKIETAHKGVLPYKDGVLPNATYKDLTDARTGVLAKNVDAAWRKLYERQAPLLTWPPEVSERFQRWGEQWPVDVDQVQIDNAINDWVQVYPAHVTAVYKSFRPFDYDTGEGVVAAPSEADLLHPVAYTVDDPPSLGKVWAAQKKLWIEGVVLNVVNTVNKDAEDWDSATIKEVQVLEVANMLAQDQRSIAKGERLKDAPEIQNPATKAAAAAAPAAAPTGAGMTGNEGMMFGGGGSSKDEADAVMVLETKTPATQFDIIPVHLAVLIDQSRIPDLIVGFENSPMAIQILDFEMNVPATPVKKPLKGEQRPMGMGNMMGMMGGPSMSMMRTMQNMMSTPMMQMQGPQGSMMSGMPGMPGQAAAKRKGTDVSKKNLEAFQKKKAEQAKGKSAAAEDDSEAPAPKKVTNPYFNIIEVRVYGQARFYKAPPPLPETPNSASPGAEASADGSAPPADPNTAVEAPKPAAPAKVDAAPAADDDDGDETEDMDKPAAKDAAPAADSDDDDADSSDDADPDDDDADDDDKPKGDAAKDAPKADAVTPPADAAQPKRR